MADGGLSARHALQHGVHPTKKDAPASFLLSVPVATGRADYFATWRSRISSSVLQSMHKVAVGRASRRLRPISTPQLSQ